MYTLLTAITISLILGAVIGAYLLAASIEYLIHAGRMDVFYDGKRAECFRLW